MGPSRPAEDSRPWRVPKRLSGVKSRALLVELHAPMAEQASGLCVLLASPSFMIRF